MAYNDDRPFCACSTPSGVSGIAVIRLSGINSATVVDSCVRIVRSGSSDKCVSKMPGYVAALADFFDPKTNTIIDRVVITRFCAPYSYTGEDIVEISCHGGSAVKQEILRVLLENGARTAKPGEFTKTAFLNGKLDLSQAEAVMDVIASDSRLSLKAANSQLSGSLRAKLATIEDKLYKALALIEMIVEFPEHDDTPESDDKLKQMCHEVQSDLEKLCDTYGQGKILSERMRIALCGLPNSGKSSLLNCLSGYDRAIVTEVPGTTRDTLEVQLDVEGIPVTLVDTAGIRRTGDKVEAIGVERAKDAAKDSDLVFYLVPPEANPLQIKEQLQLLVHEAIVDKSRIAVIFSKCDTGRNPDEKLLKEFAKDLGIKGFVSVSTAQEINIAELKLLITDYYTKLGAGVDSEVMLTNRRHCELIKEAVGYMMTANGVLEEGLGVDIASSVIRLALEEIGEISGKTVSSELADTIFSKFCIGK